MTVLVVDQDWTALRRAADALTGKNAAVTVMLKSSGESATQFAMYHPVDMVFMGPALFSEELVQKIKRLHPMAECHILGDGQDITPFPIPDVQ